jgi:hypothetical protein
VDAADLFTSSSGALSSPHNPTRKPSDRILVGNILNTSVYEGCGCRFQLSDDRLARSSRYFFVADQGKRAWMNIAGEDCELRLIGADQMSLKSRKGQRGYFRFEAADVAVRVSMVVTRTSTYEIDYEPARYAIVIQVVKGNRRQTIRTTGSCGC